MPTLRSTLVPPIDHRTLAIAIAMVAGTLWLAPGCSSGSSDAGGTTAAPRTDRALSSSTTAVRTTTSTTPSAEEDVAATYVDIMRRYFLRMQHPDPNDSDLDDLYVEPALSAVRARAKHLLDIGAVDELTDHGVPETRVLETVVRGRSAIVRACTIDDVRVVRLSDGEVLDDDVTSKLGGAVLIKSDGQWKVRSNEPIQQWPGRAGCVR